jgi:biopolymer transport protein TolQ
MNAPIASLGIFINAYSEADFFGKLIFLGLFVLSILAWIVLINKTYITLKMEKLSKSFQKSLQNSKGPLLSLSIEMLPFTGTGIPNPFVHIFSTLKQKTLEVLDKNLFFSKQSEVRREVYLSQSDLELLETSVMPTISSQVKFLEKNLFILTTIVTLAPFLGLLGTVWGILLTFGELNKGGSIGSNTMILGGLSTALVTTVVGLLIAIPALISYNYLKTKVRLFSNEMQDFLYQLLTTIELQYRKADI